MPATSARPQLADEVVHLDERRFVPEAVVSHAALPRKAGPVGLPSHRTQLRHDLSTRMIFESRGSQAAFAAAASTDEESLYFWGEDFWRGIVSLTF